MYAYKKTVAFEFGGEHAVLLAAGIVRNGTLASDALRFRRTCAHIYLTQKGVLVGFCSCTVLCKHWVYRIQTRTEVYV